MGNGALQLQGREQAGGNGDADATGCSAKSGERAACKPCVCLSQGPPACLLPPYVRSKLSFRMSSTEEVSFLCVGKYGCLPHYKRARV